MLIRHYEVLPLLLPQLIETLVLCIHACDADVTLLLKCCFISLLSFHISDSLRGGVDM